MTTSPETLLERAKEWFFYYTDPIKQMKYNHSQITALIDKTAKEIEISEDKCTKLNESRNKKMENMVVHHRQGLETLANLIHKINEVAAIIGAVPSSPSFPIEELDSDFKKQMGQYIEKLSGIIDNLSNQSESDRSHIRKQIEQLCLRLCHGIHATVESTSLIKQQQRRTEQKDASKLKQVHKDTVKSIWFIKEQRQRTGQKGARELEQMLKERTDHAKELLKSLSNTQVRIHDCFPNKTALPNLGRATSWWSISTTSEIDALIQKYQKQSDAAENLLKKYQTHKKQYEKSFDDSDASKASLYVTSDSLDTFEKAYNEEVSEQLLMERLYHLVQEKHNEAEETLDSIYSELRKANCQINQFPKQKIAEQSLMDCDKLKFNDDFPEQLKPVFIEGHQFIDELLRKTDVFVPISYSKQVLIKLQQMGVQTYTFEIKDLENQHPFPETAEIAQQSQWFLNSSRTRWMITKTASAALAGLQGVFKTLFPPDKQIEATFKERFYLTTVSWLYSSLKTGYEDGPRALHELIKECFEKNKQADQSGLDYCRHLKEVHATKAEIKEKKLLIKEKKEEIKLIENRLSLAGEKVVLSIEYFSDNDDARDFNSSSSG